MSMQNYFKLFQLPQSFDIDSAALERAYREVQNRAHPDKFANATDAEKRVALQWATYANEAFRTLKNPFKRAAYLCELNGVDLEMESNTTMPREFLMQQMEWCEVLEEAKATKDLNALENLGAELNSVRKAKLMKIGTQLNNNNYADAAQGVRQLMFLEKFDAEVQSVFEKLES